MSGDVAERGQSFEFKGKTYFRGPLLPSPFGTRRIISSEPFPATCPVCELPSDLITSQAAEIEQLRRERDALTAANDAIEIDAGLTENGNLWRYWANKARELANKLADERAARETAERLLAEARAALGPFAGDKLPGNNRNIIDYDRYGLRRCISPMEIARRDAFFTLHPDKHPLARTLTNGGENGR